MLLKSQELAEELNQEVFNHVRVHRETMNPQLPLVHYIQWATRIQVQEFLIRISSNKRLLIEYLLNIRKAKRTGSNGTDKGIGTLQEYQNRIEKILNSFPAYKREIYVSIYYHGKDKNKVARQYGISPETILRYIVEVRQTILEDYFLKDNGEG